MEPDREQLPGPHPEDAALREEIARLRASLTALLLQKDELQLIESRRLEAAYLRRFGALELKVYECWCGCLRAKKRAKLVRAAQNRRERADLEQIETVLDEELAGYRTELEERFRRVAGVLEKHEGPGLSPGGAKELKKLYRQAVKTLHPDLHPEEDETRARTLDQAMRAYRAGDLATLQAICDTLEPIPEEGELPTLEALRAEAKRLRRSLRSLDGQLEGIKSQFPFNARSLLEDEARGREHDAQLREKLRELRERTARYEAAVEGMLSPEDEEGEEP